MGFGRCGEACGDGDTSLLEIAGLRGLSVVALRIF